MTKRNTVQQDINCREHLKLRPAVGIHTNTTRALKYGNGRGSLPPTKGLRF